MIDFEAMARRTLTEFGTEQEREQAHSLRGADLEMLRFEVARKAIIDATFRHFGKGGAVPEKNPSDGVTLRHVRDAALRSGQEHSLPHAPSYITPWPENIHGYVEKLRTDLKSRWTSASFGLDHYTTRTGIKDIRDLNSAVRRGLRFWLIEGVRPENGFAIRFREESWECWVRVDLKKKKYKNAWHHFMRQFCELDYKKENSNFHEGKATRYALDHAHCLVSATVKEDARFVLLSPVPGKVNSSWGSLEAALANDGHETKDTHITHYLTVAKLFGVRAPSIAADADIDEEAKSFRKELWARGLVDEEQADQDYDGIRDLLLSARQGKARHFAKRKNNSIL